MRHLGGILNSDGGGGAGAWIAGSVVMEEVVLECRPCGDGGEGVGAQAPW